MKRKVLALLLALTLLFSMSTTSIAAFAATDPAISIEKKDAHAGDEVSIVVSIANNPGIWGMDLRISYDKTVMTLISVDNGNFYQSSEWTKGNLNADVYILSYEANDLANITTVSGTLAILNFKIKDDAALGTYNINASYNAGDIINISFDDIDFAISNGSITLTCPHTHTENRIEQPATCKDIGYTAGVFCTDCSTYVSGHKEIPILSVHSYGAWEKVNDTTHKHTCGVCGKEETANHNWNSGVVTTQPTHLAEGVKTYTCSDCGATKTESVSKITTHTYGDWEKYNESQHQRSCACGDVQYENHAWNAGAITTQPTCKDKGVKTYTCSVCGETRTEEVSVTSDHSYGAWEKANDTTHKHICGVCGKEETESHKWNSGVVTIQPTEDNTGIRTYTCTTCGATKEEVIPKLDHHHEYSIEWYNDASNHWVECSCGDKDKIAAHIWNAGTKTKEATCLEDGIMTYTCTICGYTKTETVKGEHSVGEWVIVREATCSVDGLKERKCLVCGEVIESEDIKATGHTIAEWVIVNEPTCTATGLKQQKCSVCGEVLDEEIILATGHHFGDWTVENGTLKRTCACGEIETKNIDKKAEELVPSDDGVKVDIGDSSSLPAGTSVKTDNLMDDLSDTEKDEITNAVKVIVSNDNGIELVSIYDISLEFEGAKIQPDGTVKVELPIPEESSQKFDSYQVVYIDDNGVAHEMPTEIKDGKIIFTTDHFSKYAVVGIINAETPPEPSIIPWLIVGSVVVCAAVVFVVILINKKRKKSQQNAREESEI